MRKSEFHSNSLYLLIQIYSLYLVYPSTIWNYYYLKNVKRYRFIQLLYHYTVNKNETILMKREPSSN
jgi:hypothetical protein